MRDHPDVRKAFDSQRAVLCVRAPGGETHEVEVVVWTQASPSGFWRVNMAAAEVRPDRPFAELGAEGDGLVCGGWALPADRDLAVKRIAVAVDQWPDTKTRVGVATSVQAGKAKHFECFVCAPIQPPGAGGQGKGKGQQQREQEMKTPRAKPMERDAKGQGRQEEKYEPVMDASALQAPCRCPECLKQAGRS